MSDTLASLAKSLGPKYEVRRVVGSGGFADVYEVWDKDLERRLAVKVLRPDVAWTAGMIERFQRETRAAARLEHTNILPIHFVGEGEGLVWYAMPFVDGMSLGELLKAGRFGNGFEIVQLFRAMRRVHNARRNGFDTKTADGSKRGAPHGLRRDIGGELNQSHGMDAQRTFRESGNDKFVGSRASGRDEKNF